VQKGTHFDFDSGDAAAGRDPLAPYAELCVIFANGCGKVLNVL